MSALVEVTLVRTKGFQSRPGLPTREVKVSGEKGLVERAVEKLASGGEWAVANDLHPDDFEDWSMRG